MAQRLNRKSMCVLKWASSLSSNPFATYLKDILSQSTKNTYSYSRHACGHGDVGTCPHQVFAVTLTLSQPGGGADYAHPILVSPTSFESHRHACMYKDWHPKSVKIGTYYPKNCGLYTRTDLSAICCFFGIFWGLLWSHPNKQACSFIRNLRVCLKSRQHSTDIGSFWQYLWLFFETQRLVTQLLSAAPKHFTAPAQCTPHRVVAGQSRAELSWVCCCCLY